MRRAIAGLLVMGAIAGALVASCGPIEPPPPNSGGDAGRLCVNDSDCVPNACCGVGTGAVHRLDGPNCGSASCDGGCPANQVRCGCGLPVCKDQRCAVAVAVGQGC